MLIIISREATRQVLAARQLGNRAFPLRWGPVPGTSSPEGVKAGPGSEPFTSFLERFWNFEDSLYVRERLAHDQWLSRRRCHDAHNRLEHYWKPYFRQDKRLSEIRKSDIGAFSLWLKEDKELQAKTINNVTLSRDSRPPLGSTERDHSQWLVPVDGEDMTPAKPALDELHWGSLRKVQEV